MNRIKIFILPLLLAIISCSQDINQEVGNTQYENDEIKIISANILVKNPENLLDKNFYSEFSLLDNKQYGWLEILIKHNTSLKNIKIDAQNTDDWLGQLIEDYAPHIRSCLKPIYLKPTTKNSVTNLQDISNAKINVQYNLSNIVSKELYDTIVLRLETKTKKTMIIKQILLEY